MNNDNLVINNTVEIKAFGEHKDKSYYVYFESISPNLMYYKFSSKHDMEEFLYRHGIERFDYKSSNGKVTTKIWKYNLEELEKWKLSKFRTKKEKQQGTPEKYSWDDWYCGHFIKDRGE